MIKQNKLWDLRLKVNVLLNIFSKTKILVLFLLIYYLISCSKPKAFIGTYRCCKGNYWSSRYINIREDSTFSYWETYCLGKDSTSGKWKIKKNNLILNTYRKQPQIFSDAFELVQTNSINTDSLIVHLVDNENEPIPFRFCALMKNGKATLSETDWEGKCKFKNIDYDSITFDIQNNKLYFPLKKGKYNFYLFKDIIDFNPREVYYSNEKWKIKKNTLVTPNDRRFRLIDTSNINKLQKNK